MQQYAAIPYLEKQNPSPREVAIKSSDVHRAFGKLLKRVYKSDDHLVVERDGFPMAVLMSYQEYEKFKRQQMSMTSQESI